MKLKIKKVKDELTRIKKSQAWLAQQMGVKPQWVHQILKDHDSISHTLRTIERVADALNIDPKDLIE